MASNIIDVSTGKAVCDCAVGNAYFDADGICRCTANADTYIDGGIKTSPPKILGLPITRDSIATSIVDWVKAHPFIVAGGLGLLFYFFFIMRKRSGSRFIR